MRCWGPLKRPEDATLKEPHIVALRNDLRRKIVTVCLLLFMGLVEQWYRYFFPTLDLKKNG